MKLIRRQLKQTILLMGTLISISLIQTAYPHFFDDQNIEIFLVTIKLP